MATCRVCKGVGSYLVLYSRGRYRKDSCYVCEGAGVIIEHDLLLDTDV